MPQKVIKFKGINRMINEFQTSGECEELINLRPQLNGGHRVVKSKSITRHSVPYEKIYEHSFGNFRNQIAINTNGAIDWIDESGTVGAVTEEFIGKSIDVSTAGNVVVFYASDGKQLVFKFEDGSYQKYSASLPSIDISVQLNDFTASVTHTGESVNNTLSESQETLTSAFSSFYNTYPHGLAGPIVVGCTFELEDGSEVWSSGFSIIDPTKDKRYVSATSTGLTATVGGAKEAVLKFTVDNFSSVSGVKNIKFYSSVPLSPYEMTDSDASSFYPKKISNSELNLSGQTMYLQKVISFRKTGELRLDTGSKIAAGDLMPVTSGVISRTGRNVSYNSRFHFYGSTVGHTLQGMSYGVHSNRELPDASNEVTIKSATMYVVIDNGSEKTGVYRSGTFDIQMFAPMDFVYPLGGVKQGYLKTSDGGWYSIPFEDSSAYNYSCALDYIPSTPVDEPSFDSLIEEHGQSVVLRKEQNALNVSAQYNPFIFPVEYSYSFTGEILDVATSYLPISSTQVGQYPLTVFTTSGVYALEQGDGQVLYSNITPLQPLVATGKPVSTPHGTFFISSKNVYLLSGRESVNITQVLDGERDIRLRSNASYQKVCCSGSSPLVDYSFILSSIDFNEFVDNATLIYDQLNNELYISSTLPDINYSYVFNLTTNTFHKVAKKYISGQQGYRYAIEAVGGSRNLVDMHSEESGHQPILLQSRPMSLEVLYTHIQRLMLLVDAGLSGSQHLCVTVFASDNLYDWKCIISAQKQRTALRQIRTNRAAKSYKDYVILISGYVSTDTDISDLIADYTVVNRRLG